MNGNWICPMCMSPSEGETCPQCGAQCNQHRPMAQALPPQTILAGRYLVGGAVGGGGFGITYRALDLKPIDPDAPYVAIKEYFPRAMAMRDGDFQVKPHERAAADFALWRDKVGQEYRMLVHLQRCDAVVDVRDVFTENGTVYLVMDFVQGETLESRVKNQGPIPALELIRMLAQLLPELQKMHAANVLHRDINPANIMLPAGKCPKLIDFGSARPNPRSNNTALTVLVRRGYAPPEQHERNGRQGTWTDVYGLCACLYYALSGVEPPDAQARNVNDTLQPLQVLCPEAPDVLTEAIMLGMKMEVPLRVPDFETLWHLIEPAAQEEYDEPDDGLTDEPMPAPEVIRARTQVTQPQPAAEPERPITQLYRGETEILKEQVEIAALQKRLQAAMQATKLLKVWNPTLAKRISLELEALKIKISDISAPKRLETIISEGGKVYSAVVSLFFRK